MADPSRSAAPLSRIFQSLGPGVLFAGAAIGVSHLVQATRAGAVYGLSLIGLVVLAHAMKLPAMLFGPRYAAATGTSLLQGYREQGRHAVIVFAVITVGTAFTIQAVVTMVTAALVQGVLLGPALGVDLPLWGSSVGVLVICGVLIAAGGFGWLDGTLKVLMGIMAASTVFAAVLALPRVVGQGWSILPSIPADPAARIALVGFAVALAGWMPAPLDISVWHSLWTIAREKQTRHAPTRREAEIDFGVGYTLCLVLAIGFLLLGAAELYGTGLQPATGSAGFAAQLIDLYTASIGEWVRPVIAACALAVMFSTTLTVLDALPRTVVSVFNRFRFDERPQDPSSPTVDLARTSGYWCALLAIALGATGIVAGVRGSGFQGLVNIATTLSFLGTPVLAWFNHRAMVSGSVSAEHRPGSILRMWSWIGIVFWVTFAGVFVWSRLVG